MSQHLTPKAVLFDFYNTLLEIRTKEHDPEVWAQLSRFLSYQGARIDAAALHDAFFADLRAMQQARCERYPEINIVQIFRYLLHDLGCTGFDHFAVPLTQLFRALSIRRFRTFPDTQPALHTLRCHFKLGLVSDAQRVFLDPEMAQIGVLDLFDVRVISSDYGFRKPDARLFTMALDRLGVSAAEAIYIGDDVFRDISGAQIAGIKAVLVQRHDQTKDLKSTCAPALTVQTLAEVVEWLTQGAAPGE